MQQRCNQEAKGVMRRSFDVRQDKKKASSRYRGRQKRVSGNGLEWREGGVVWEGARPQGVRGERPVFRRWPT